MRLLGGVGLDDRVPIVVQLPAPGDGPDIGRVMGMGRELVVVLGLLGAGPMRYRHGAEENRNTETDCDERGWGHAETMLYRTERVVHGHVPL